MSVCAEKIDDFISIQYSDISVSSPGFQVVSKSEPGLYGNNTTGKRSTTA